MKSAHDELQGARAPRRAGAARAYWRAILLSLAGLLAGWSALAYGAGVLAYGPMSAVTLAGRPLASWIAEYGSIALFVVVIGLFLARASALERARRPFRTDEDAPS